MPHTKIGTLRCVGQRLKKKFCTHTDNYRAKMYHNSENITRETSPVQEIARKQKQSLEASRYIRVNSFIHPIYRVMVIPWGHIVF